MAESKPEPSSKSSTDKDDKDVKAPNVFERAKEEIEAILHAKTQPNQHDKETHGLRNDIDTNTSINDVKAPNVFERAKEEFEALVQTFHPKKEPKTHGSPSNGERREVAIKAESKSEKPDCHSDKDVKAPNVFERAKEEIEAILHAKTEPNQHDKESHGLRNDIDANTSINDVKAPTVFERAREEIEALVQTIHPKKEPKTHGSPSNVERRDVAIKAESKSEKPDCHSEKDVKAPNLIERAKEEIEAFMHKAKSPHSHHKETHGTSDDIDENTPIGEIKGPNVFERAKEEIEALVQTIHPRKESERVVSSPKKEGGFRVSIGKEL